MIVMSLNLLFLNAHQIPNVQVKEYVVQMEIVQDKLACVHEKMIQWISA
jgi:hypothetical protein